MKEGRPSTRHQPTRWKVDDRVMIIGTHPWALFKGTVVRLETPGMFPERGERPVVKLDPRDEVPPNHECFLMSDTEAVATR